jgi:hypothetical protein
VEFQLQQLLNISLIQISYSPCASPIFIIPKKESEEWYLFMDYWALNKAMIKNHYPLLCIDYLLDHSKGACFFTKIDLIAGYHQVYMNAIDTWKTYFKTKYGIYEWMVIPFGITNVPSTSMRLINDIFKEHLGKIMVMYLEDILVFSNTCEDQFLHLCIVLDIFPTHKLQVKHHKSSFG